MEMIRSKLDGGQLDEAPLTLRDLDQIEKAFIKTLTGIYHERIEYPKLDVGKKKEESGEKSGHARD